MLEIFRQFSIRNERPIIGHHLKVIIVSAELLKRQKMEQLMDLVLRDNDIRPSTMVFISEGRADDTLISKRTDEIPSFHIKEMINNQFRTSKVLHPVILSQLDSLMHAKKVMLCKTSLQQMEIPCFQVLELLKEIQAT